MHFFVNFLPLSKICYFDFLKKYYERLIEYFNHISYNFLLVSKKTMKIPILDNRINRKVF